MKIYAHYDLAGTIHSLVSMTAPEGAGMMMAPKAGLFVIEIEGVKLKADAPEVETVREIAKNYRVPTPLARCKLVKKR